jgi:hypothetical protein
MCPTGMQQGSGAYFGMMGASSRVCRASFNKAMNDDEGDDKFEAVEVWSVALLAGRFLEGTRRDVS